MKYKNLAEAAQAIWNRPWSLSNIIIKSLKRLQKNWKSFLLLNPIIITSKHTNKDDNSLL